MKKKAALALASAILCATASAQSSVTLFGLLDASYSYGSGSIAKKSQLANSAYNSSKIGFSGREDLGGGLAAGFWLEAGIANDNGYGQPTNANNQTSGAGTATSALTFNRRATVSLLGSFGELRLGRDYTAHFWNLNVFDAFNTNGVGATLTYANGAGGLTVPRASNIIGYLTPSTLGGFYAQAQHYFGENASNAPDEGTGNSLRVGYASGPLEVSAATGATRYEAGDAVVRNVGASYLVGTTKLLAQYSADTVRLPVAVQARGGQVGALIGVGAGQIRLAYSTYKRESAGNPRTDKLALGYVHNLSKRTALYATAARVRNSGGAAFTLNGAVTAANQSSSGYDIGLRHSF